MLLRSSNLVRFWCRLCGGVMGLSRSCRISSHIKKSPCGQGQWGTSCCDGQEEGWERRVSNEAHMPGMGSFVHKMTVWLAIDLTNQGRIEQHLKNQRARIIANQKAGENQKAAIGNPALLAWLNQVLLDAATGRKQHLFNSNGDSVPFLIQRGTWHNCLLD